MSTCSDLQKSGQWASCFQAKVLSGWVEPAAEKSCGQSSQYPHQVELNRKWGKIGKDKSCEQILVFKTTCKLGSC